MRRAVLEQHWGYMDQFAGRMVVRGPTFSDDGTLTGSVHIVDLPDVIAARAFAVDEPGYQAGVHRDVMLGAAAISYWVSDVKARRMPWGGRGRAGAR